MRADVSNCAAVFTLEGKPAGFSVILLCNLLFFRTGAKYTRPCGWGSGAIQSQNTGRHFSEPVFFMDQPWSGGSFGWHGIVENFLRAAPFVEQLKASNMTIIVSTPPSLLFFFTKQTNFVDSCYWPDLQCTVEHARDFSKESVATTDWRLLSGYCISPKLFGMRHQYARSTQSSTKTLPGLDRNPIGSPGSKTVPTYEQNHCGPKAHS